MMQADSEKTSVGTTCQWSIGLIRWCPLLLLFGTYPLALIVPVLLFTSLVFHVSLPSFFLLSMLALSWLCLTSLRDGGTASVERAAGVRGISWAAAARIGFVLATLLCIASAIHGRTADWMHVFRQIGYFAVPLYFATCPRKFLPRCLAKVLAILWLVQVLHGLWQYRVGHEVVGLAGNRNWMATLILALCPWVWLAYHEQTGRRGKTPSHPPSPCSLSGAVLATGSALISLFLAYRGHCRATWLTLAAYATLFVALPRLSRRIKIAMIALVPVLAVLCVLVYGQRIAAMIEDDIRLPLYAQTVRLIHDHAVLGVGPGNFRRDFVRYRSFAHKARRHAAPVTEHPHNEWLHVAAQLGWPGVLLWCLLLLPLLRTPHPTAFWRTVHFSAFMIFGHAMLDKLLVQAPTDLLGFMLLGFLWRPLLPVRGYCGQHSGRRLVLVRALALAAGMYALTIGIRELRMSWYLRKAQMLQDLNRLQESYEAFRHGAEINPRNVRAQAYAGICANNDLRDHVRALEHLQQVVALEPDFAHANGEIGLALGGLGRHHEALPFFERDAYLFPFDPVAHQRLYLSRLVTGHVTGLPELFDRIGNLRYRRTEQRLETDHIRTLASAFLWAAHERLPGRAAIAGRHLLRHIVGNTAEPDFFPLATATGTAIDAYDGPISVFDLHFWHRAAWALRHRVRFADMDLRQLVETFEAISAASPSPRGELRTAPATLPSTDGTHQFDIDLLAEWAAQAGADLAVLRSANGQEFRMAELRRDHDACLIDLTSGAIKLDADLGRLVTDPALQEELGLRLPADIRLVAALRISPTEFFSRTQAVGQIVERALGLPGQTLGRSPALRRIRYQTAVQEVAANIDVVFDEKPFRDLAADP